MKLSVKLTIISLIIAAVSGILVPVILKMTDNYDEKYLQQRIRLPEGVTNYQINKTINMRSSE